MSDATTIIDLTGDQFEYNNRPAIYIGNEDAFSETMVRYGIIENYDFIGENNQRLCYDYEAILRKMNNK